MKRSKSIAYIAAWSLYIAFSLMAFSEFRITVMLFSIPLTIVGGWLYTYKGAFATTFLTIPYHYLMLRYHTSDPDVLIEAFNPFGIGTQLCFSMGTALLRSTQLRYQQLNRSLEKIVNERTTSLSQLADHLIENEEMKAAFASTGLLNDPTNQLSEMEERCNRIAQQLKKEQHHGFETADIIRKLIHVCMQQLRGMELQTPTISNLSLRPGDSIKQFIQQFDSIAVNTALTVSGNWEELDSNTAGHLYPIMGEAITNALRHASPSQILIDLHCDPSLFIVSIENDGKPMQTEISKGMGISLMKHRARRIGATLSFKTEIEENTRIECIIPRNRE